ncbi:uncharacterized protein LOC110726658 [Chenopodium quinoa]|uniref:uncharacterized protein LOC110726658 n=1 Tax=Chenopodium quinoa TaxID=63459 RepID=UPI000B792EA6|nr:uncharacterized protein LOC110726658 [Chenopodium quinoa]
MIGFTVVILDVYSVLHIEYLLLTNSYNVWHYCSAGLFGWQNNIAYVLRSEVRKTARALSKNASKHCPTEDVLVAAIGRQLPTEPFILSEPFYCDKCGAKKFMFESLHFCCRNGDIEIAAPEYPSELVYLFTSKDEVAVHFKKYARLYNNLFAYSSLGGHYYASTYKGIYVFKLHGQMYHFVPHLLANDNSPKYLKLDRVIHADTTIVLSKNPVLDQRVYNAPSVDDVAVIWPENASSSQTLGPHILVTGQSDESHRIYHNYGCYDPLQYPLLFPRGECGWTQGLKKNSHPNRRAADSLPDPIMSCAVHTAAELIAEEETRAKRHNTRADKFISAREYYAYKLQIRPNNMLLRAGRCFQQYIVDMYVKIENTRLDYFRNNQESIRVDLYKGILDSLDSGETLGYNVGRRVILPPTYIGGPRDMKKRYLNAMALVHRFGKPDLFVTITCNANWPEIKNELATGETAQDRPDLVARIFRAKVLALKKEIMEKKVFGEVAAMVYVIEFQKRGLPHAHFLIILKPKYKLKSPDDYDRFCPCMRKDGLKLSCKNKYPKQFCSETTNTKDGYPVYRRRETGERVTIRSAQLDNQWVIPYNPYLSLLFDCHLNVEVCSTIKAVKYLYKYIYKGRDRISYNVVPSTAESVDEIDQYQSGRWVSPCEAAWRIFSFDLFEMYHAVLPLQVHLPNMQTVHIHPHERLRSVVSDSKRSRTQLTEFFAMNATSEYGLGYLYEGERFYLRLLLLNVKSPKSFEALRTVNGCLYPTFQEAALKLGLVEDDDAANSTMAEAYFSHKFPNQPLKIQQLTVRAVEQHLEAMGKSLASFGLEELNSQFSDEFRRTKDILDALDAPIPEECLSCRSKLNLAQNAAFESIMEHVMQQKSGAFFIDGPGGTGKTFLYNALYAQIRQMNKIVLPRATLGIAAANIPSGRTAHSRFKIQINDEGSLACDVPKQGSLEALLKETTLIIWDEASMAKKKNLESLDLLLQDICGNKLLFGGKVVVFGGDFRQVFPVVPRKTMKEAVEASIVTSYLWPKFIKFRLTENIRAREDPLYSAFLLALGNGELQQSENAFIELPEQTAQCDNNSTEIVGVVTEATFPEVVNGKFDCEVFAQKAILTPMNDDVDSINTFMIEQFPGQAVTYKSFDAILNDTCSIYPTEFINKLCPGGMSPHELVLKENCLVILLRNLLPSSGLCNGTRLICKNFFPNVIHYVIAVGHYKGEKVFIHRINLRPSSSVNYPFMFERKQFPIKLSFAMTINKSQGQTLNQVSIYIPQPCFSHGQLYVALSRAKKSKDVRVFTKNAGNQCSANAVKNVVSYALLRLAEMGEEATKVAVPKLVFKKQKREEEWAWPGNVQKKKRVEIRKLITNYSSKFDHIK